VPLDYLALDASVRAYSKDDGRLYVKVSHISKACVNPYRGAEIPGAETLGLDRDKVYMLLRDPEELALSVPTWNAIPLLIKHTPMTADDHQRDVVVGSLGTDAAFRAPYLDNSLAIWDGEAIAGVESGDLRQLSGGYHYVADMTPGTFNDEPYDGIMRDIRGNHVALVETGRAGNDVLVMDSAIVEPSMTQRVAAKPRRVAAISPRELLTAGALQAYLPSRMAKDAAMPDFNRLIKGAKDTKEIASRVRTAVTPLLAKDGSLSDLETMIDSLKGPAMEPDVAVSNNPDDTGLGDPEGTNEFRLDANDDDLEEKIRELLSGKLDDADMEMLMKLIHPADADAPSPDPDNDGVVENPEDAPADPDNDGVNENPFGKKDDDDDANDRRVARDRGRRGRDALPPALKENQVDKPAMDAAIRLASEAAVAAAVKKTREAMDARSAAERFVRPWIGEVTVAMDSAEEVYRTALDTLGVQTKGVHPSAFKTILSHMPKPGDTAPRVRQAMDSSGQADFASRFPNASRLRVVG
jgi:hypothetical protein